MTNFPTWLVWAQCVVIFQRVTFYSRVTGCLHHVAFYEVSGLDRADFGSACPTTHHHINHLPSRKSLGPLLLIFLLCHVLFSFCLLPRRQCLFPILKEKSKKASCCCLIFGINERTDVCLKYNFMSSKPGWEAKASVRRYEQLIFSILMKRNIHMNNTYLWNMNQSLSYQLQLHLNMKKNGFENKRWHFGRHLGRE